MESSDLQGQGEDEMESGRVTQNTLEGEKTCWWIRNVCRERKM